MTLEEMEKRLKATEDALEEMRERVRVTEDIQEIHQLQRRYVNAMMCTEWDDAVDCFAENGATDFPEYGVSRGKAAIEKVFKEGIAYQHIGEEATYCIHPIISVEGDKAKGSWLLYIHGVLPHKPRNYPPDLAARIKEVLGEGEIPDWVQGYYEMEYIRENGKWKINLLRWRARIKSPR